MAMAAATTTSVAPVERLRLAPLRQPSLHNAHGGKEFDPCRVVRPPVAPRCTPRDSYRERFAAAEAKLYAAERQNKALVLEKAELERENRQLHQYIAELMQSPRARLDLVPKHRLATVAAGVAHSSSSVEASPEAFPIHLCAQCHRVIQPAPTAQSRAVQVCEEALTEATGCDQPDASSWDRDDELASTCSVDGKSDSGEEEDGFPITAAEHHAEPIVAPACDAHAAEIDEAAPTFSSGFNASGNRSAVMSGLLPTPRFTTDGRIVRELSPSDSCGGASSCGSNESAYSRAAMHPSNLVVPHRRADLHHGTAVVGLLEGFLAHRRVEVAGLRRVAEMAEAEIQRIYELEEEDSRLRQEAALLRGEIESKRRIREMFADAPFLSKLTSSSIQRSPSLP